MSEKLTLPVDSVWDFLSKLSSVAGFSQHAGSPPALRERRRYKRIPMAGKISYREAGADTWDDGWIQDFSYGGSRIATSRILSVGQTIDIRVRLPINNDFTELRGTVVWSSPRQSADDLFDIGICFSKHCTYQVQVINAAANEMVTLALKSAHELGAHQALSIDDLQDSLALTYREHDPNFPDTRNNWVRYCNEWTFSSSAATFILKSHEQTFGTITLVRDSELGMPSDHFFPEEISLLRSSSRCLGEITLLALDSESLTERFAKTELGRLTAFIRLLKIAFDYARLHDITDLLIAVSPAYQNTLSYLLFNPLTDRTNPENFESWIPMHLNIARAKAEQKSMHAGILEYLYDTSAVTTTLASRS